MVIDEQLENVILTICKKADSRRDGALKTNYLWAEKNPKIGPMLSKLKRLNAESNALRVKLEKLGVNPSFQEANSDKLIAAGFKPPKPPTLTTNQVVTILAKMRREEGLNWLHENLGIDWS